jgi:hypothetical protein
MLNTTVDAWTCSKYLRAGRRERAGKAEQVQGSPWEGTQEEGRPASPKQVSREGTKLTWCWAKKPLPFRGQQLKVRREGGDMGQCECWLTL